MLFFTLVACTSNTTNGQETIEDNSQVSENDSNVPENVEEVPDKNYEEESYSEDENN